MSTEPQRFAIGIAHHVQQTAESESGEFRQPRAWLRHRCRPSGDFDDGDAAINDGVAHLVTMPLGTRVELDADARMLRVLEPAVC